MTSSEWIVHPNRSELGPDRPGRNGHYRTVGWPRPAVSVSTCLARVKLPRKLSELADADGSVTFGGLDWWFVVGAARTFARRKEIAIRSAMGASRARIVQQLLGESLIISLCGGALGLLAAHYGIQLLIKFFADKLPRIGDIGLNAPVLAFTLVLSIATGLLSGLLPAWSMTKGDVNEALKQGLGRTDADSGTGKTRSALVVVEVALSLVLLIGAGLMLRSLWNLQTIDPGFDQHNVLTLSVMVNKQQFTDPTQESQFFDNVLQRIRSLPGVESAGAVDDLPLQGGSNQPVAIEGQPALDGQHGGLRAVDHIQLTA